LRQNDRHRRSDRRKFQDYKVLDPARKILDKRRNCLSRAATAADLHLRNQSAAAAAAAAGSLSASRSSDRKPVKYDDCRDSDGTMIEAKGHYEEARKDDSSVIALISNG